MIKSGYQEGLHYQSGSRPTDALEEQLRGKDFSSGEGTGTAFHVTLPFAIDPTPTAVADNTADSIDLTGMQILLAEDNELNMEIKQFFIEQHGGTVLPVQNGQEVVKHFAVSAPGEIDLILMDVMMPLMSVYKATGPSGRCRVRCKDYPYPSHERQCLPG